MLRRYMAVGLVGLLIQANASALCAETKDEKRIREARANADRLKEAFVVVDSRGGAFKGKILGHLIDINDDGIVLADRSNQYGVGNIPVAYRDIQSIKLGAIKTYTAEPVPLGKSGPPIFKNPLVGKAVHAGVVE